MSAINTYGYGSGQLSNSMIQQALACPVAYQKTFVDKEKQAIEVDVFDGTTCGSLVHLSLEEYDTNRTLATMELWKLVYKLVGPDFSNRLAIVSTKYQEAVKRTNEYGAQWGTVYKAPEFTNFWKKNFGALDQEIAKLERDIQDKVPGIYSESFVSIVQRANTSLDNWFKMDHGKALHHEIKVNKDHELANLAGTVDRVESRPGKNNVAICDYKTGKWAYDYDKVVNNDQFGLYDQLLAEQLGVNVVEWVLYDLYVGNVIKVVPTDEIRSKFKQRLSANLNYMRIMAETAKTGQPLFIPAGSTFNSPCTQCFYAKSNSCEYRTGV